MLSRLFDVLDNLAVDILGHCIATVAVGCCPPDAATENWKL